MVESSKPDNNREKYFENLNDLNFETLLKKYTYKNNIMKRIINKIKKIVLSK